MPARNSLARATLHPNVHTRGLHIFRMVQAVTSKHWTVIFRCYFGIQILFWDLWGRATQGAYFGVRSKVGNSLFRSSLFCSCRSFKKRNESELLSSLFTKRGPRANCSCHFFLRRLEQNERIALFTFSNTRALYKSGLCSFLKRKRRAGLRHLNYTFWLCLKKAEKKSKSLSSLFSKRAKVQFALLKRAK